MQSNQELIDHLVATGVLRTPAIIEAFEAVDRINFVRSRSRREAYGDYPLSIGHGQTISQPYTVAFMLEHLQVQSGDSVLDVGSGSGWTTALLAYIVQAKGNVLGIEIVPELVDYGQANLKKYAFAHAKITRAGTQPGCPGSEFDKILVSASARELPSALVEQLKIGGRMVIPIRSSIYRIDKVSATQIEETEYYGFSFVPLIY